MLPVKRIPWSSPARPPIPELDRRNRSHRLAVPPPRQRHDCLDPPASRNICFGLRTKPAGIRTLSLVAHSEGRRDLWGGPCSANDGLRDRQPSTSDDLVGLARAVRPRSHSTTAGDGKRSFDDARPMLRIGARRGLSGRQQVTFVSDAGLRGQTLAHTVTVDQSARPLASSRCRMLVLIAILLSRLSIGRSSVDSRIKEIKPWPIGTKCLRPVPANWP